MATNNNTEIKSLSDVIDFAIGGDWGKDTSFESKEYVDVSVIRGKEFTNWEKLKATNSAIRRIKISSLEKRVLQVGDLVIEISGGGPTQPVGRVIIIDDNVVKTSSTPLVCSNFFRLVRLAKEVDPLYIKYALDYVYQSGEVTKYQTGSTNLRNLSFTKYIDQVKIPLPDKDEQQEIAKIIKNLSLLNLETKSNILKAKKYLQKFRQSVLSSAVTGKLTDEWRKNNPKSKVNFASKIAFDLNNINEIPDSWSWCGLGEVSLLITKGSSPTWQGIKYTSEGVLFVTSENVGNNKLLLDNKKYLEKRFNSIQSRSILKNGDLLTNIVGASIGRTAIYNLDEEANINQAVAVVRLNTDLLLSEYAAHVLNSPYLLTFMSNEKVDVARANISLKDVSNFPIPLPSIDEQHEIIKKVKSMFEVANLLEKQIEIAGKKTDMLTQSILAKAFRGELIV